MVIVTDNNKPKPRGHKTKDEKERQMEGERLHEILLELLQDHNKVRPMCPGMKINDAGQIYFDH